MNTPIKGDWKERFRQAFGNYWSRSPEGNVMYSSDMPSNTWAVLERENVESFFFSELTRIFERIGERMPKKENQIHGKDCLFWADDTEGLCTCGLSKFERAVDEVRTLLAQIAKEENIPLK